jgi:hypothetical protein
MEFEQRKYMKIRNATHTPWVLIDAVHATAPRSDPYTGSIVSAVSEITGCHCIIATVSRTEADLNRPPGPANENAIREYRDNIQAMLEGSQLISNGTLVYPFLHLAIHGMLDRDYADIELGTRHGKTCSPIIRKWIQKKFDKTINSLSWKGRRPKIVIDKMFIGDSSKEFHRHGDQGQDFSGYGQNFHTIQMEYAHWLRENHRDKLIDALCQIIGQFRLDFCCGD